MKSVTLKASEIKEKISTGLTPKLLSDGFVYKKGDNEFRRQIKEFTYIFNIEQAAWNTSYSLHTKLYISEKRIESILEMIIGKLRHKVTLGQEIDRIYKSPDGREIVNGDLSIWIREDQDVEAALESLDWYYRDIAIPYFDKFNSLEAIDDFMNKPPFDYCPAYVGGRLDNRCMKGLIVARLVNNPCYEEVAAIYDDRIKETMNAQSIDNYHKVREYLMYNQIGRV